jgi:hypothetical protein
VANEILAIPALELEDEATKQLPEVSDTEAMPDSN